MPSPRAHMYMHTYIKTQAHLLLANSPTFWLSGCFRSLAPERRHCPGLINYACTCSIWCWHTNLRLWLSAPRNPDHGYTSCWSDSHPRRWRSGSQSSASCPIPADPPAAGPRGHHRLLGRLLTGVHVLDRNLGSIIDENSLWRRRWIAGLRLCAWVIQLACFWGRKETRRRWKPWNVDLLNLLEFGRVDQFGNQWSKSWEILI